MSRLEEIEVELDALMQPFRGAIPIDRFDPNIETLRAGEPGVALETLCDQLLDDDIAVPEGVRATLERLGTEMGLAPRYWQRLRVE